MVTGQQLPDGSFFDSGALSLDFSASPLVNQADLDAWLGERFDRLQGAASERELADAHALRAAIGRVAAAAASASQPEADDIDTVNLFAATPDIPPALGGGRRQAGAGRVRIGQALSTVARDAVDLFGERGPGRIRFCTADDCELVFYDESRSNNRRWCSMQRCGNRAKVRAHRARSISDSGGIRRTVGG
ncbi:MULTISPECIES: CGNR zinc finger domain-containing protein [unclassified Salinibacterium]|uniref:CGNR zinc finger domain-containing protein n=1 Tax=unclassified Salinibacterium TaxID=2632331 RepID=UPI001421F898|nr:MULTISPECIES: CGNR zinc finger domain-containing protein [unclassified Salinibacterium]